MSSLLIGAIDKVIVDIEIASLEAPSIGVDLVEHVHVQVQSTVRALIHDPHRR